MIDTDLKIQMVFAFKDAYLYTLKNMYKEYATNNTLELITHLYSHYACISITGMAENE